MTTNREKYFLAIVPPQKSIEYFDSFRHQYNHNFQSAPAHITLYPPFYSQVSESQLFKNINEIFVYTNSFRVSFTSIDFFTGNNNVAFFKPDSDSTTYLRNLYQKTRTNLSCYITDVWQNYPVDQKDFNPHCTIAQHISNDKFPGIRQELESVQVEQYFDVNSVVLLRKQPDNWLPIFESKFDQI